MEESINTENTKQSRQKPPLSKGRIVCEILAGTVLCVVALLVVCGTGIILFGGGDFTGSIGQLHAIGYLVIFICFFPPLYVLGSAVGVYFVGSRGNETGSLLATLGGGILGGIVIVLLVFSGGGGDKPVGTVEKIIIWGFLSLIGPSMAALAFNLTRRYKDRKNINE